MKLKIFSIIILSVMVVPFWTGVLLHGPFTEFLLPGENRKATILSWPQKLTSTRLDKFRKNLNMVISDRLIYKHALVHATKNYILPSTYYFSTDMTHALLGKHGFVFLGNRYQNVINRHFRAFSPDAEHNEWLLESHLFFKEIASAQNADYFAFIAPDKHGIYCHEIPDWVKTDACNTVTRVTRQQISFLEKHGIQVIYPFEILRQKALNQCIYYKTDSHWNLLGAEFAFFALMEDLAKKGKIFTTNPFVKNHDYVLAESKGTDIGDLGKMANLPDSFKLEDSVFTMIPPSDFRSVSQSVKFGTHKINSAVPNRQKIVVIHDSFTEAMKPFWECHFAEVLYLPAGNDNEVYREIIESFKPDLVLYEMVERYL